MRANGKRYWGVWGGCRWGEEKSNQTRKKCKSLPFSDFFPQSFRKMKKKLKTKTKKRTMQCALDFIHNARCSIREHRCVNISERSSYTRVCQENIWRVPLLRAYPTTLSSSTATVNSSKFTFDCVRPNIEFIFYIVSANIRHSSVPLVLPSPSE